VISPAMAQNSFLVGAFAQSTILFARDVLNIQMSFQKKTISSEIPSACGATVYLTSGGRKRISARLGGDHA
jgi:hypothetical protein